VEEDMSNPFNCPHCNAQNQVGASFCKSCGQSFNKSNKASKKGRGKLANWVADKANQVLDATDDFLDAILPTDPTVELPPLPGQESPPPVAQQPVTRRTPQKIAPKSPGGTISYYQILETKALGRSNYYVVFGYRCESCSNENLNNMDLKCTRCQKPLRKHVLRESYAYNTLDDIERGRVKGLSDQIQGVLTHNMVFYLGNTQYILLDGFPDPWFSLAQDRILPVRETSKATTWIVQLGKAIKQLHQVGFSFYDENKLADWVEPILVLKNQQAYFADITSYAPIQPGSNATQQKDIFYLAKVLYTMATGNRQNVSRITGRLLEVPSPFRDVIRQAQSGGFSTVDAFLNAVQRPPKEPEMARSLRQLVGYSTDVGKQRDHNEDYVSKFSLGLEQIPGTPEVGLYIVADGMGGHQAGEKASEAVIKDVVINRIQEQLQQLQAVPKLKRATIKLGDMLTPGDILREAIEQANKVLLNARSASSGRDRGTTITAALVIGETCSVANVGDSRTYLMRGGNLKPVTQDHSLVASLVSSGMIKPSEVRSHPQRNQIYRTLGDKPEVEVDIFTETLQPGDQIMLCSDGLWEMVLDDSIAKILGAARTPQSACDRLIEAANAGGGEDNISVIVIWLE
jgi:serine/threonine protein phosphatase PrpC